jgi:hypothetical protein
MMDGGWGGVNNSVRDDLLQAAALALSRITEGIDAGSVAGLIEV